MVDINTSPVTSAPTEKPRPRGYFVNGEQFHTIEFELTVRAVLQNAGFTPVEEYRLARDHGHHIYENYDVVVPIHDGERFTATFLGPTLTS